MGVQEKVRNMGEMGDRGTNDKTSQAHAPNHFSRLGFRKLVPVNVDPAFLDLSQIRLDQTIVKILEERKQAVFKGAVGMSLLCRFHRL